MNINLILVLCAISIVVASISGRLTTVTNIISDKYDKYMKISIAGVICFISISFAFLIINKTIHVESNRETVVNSITNSVSIDMTKEYSVRKECENNKEYYIISGSDVDGNYVQFSSRDVNEITLFVPAKEEFRFIPSEEIRLEVTEETATYRFTNMLRNIFYATNDLTAYTLYVPEDVVQNMVKIK